MPLGPHCALSVDLVRDGVSGLEILKDAKKGSLTRLLFEDSQNSLLLFETKEAV